MKNQTVLSFCDLLFDQSHQRGFLGLSLTPKSNILPNLGD